MGKYTSKFVGLLPTSNKYENNNFCIIIQYIQYYFNAIIRELTESINASGRSARGGG